MVRAWRSLRVRLAVLGFVAIYVPVLLLFGVGRLTEEEQTTTVEDGQVTQSRDVERSAWVTWTVVALGPGAAGLAWWWAGRAVRPLNRMRLVTQEIEATDLSRRIGLDNGPTEIVELAASFDSMLERLEQAASVQRELIEEASHELRTPLATLRTNADVLLAHPDPTIAVFREGLERSQAAAGRMQTTIDELLVDARGRTRRIERQPADLMAIATGVVEAARVLAAAKSVEMALSGPAEARCSVDEPSVTRALSNLVDNAIRHSPEGSRVELTLEASESTISVAVTDHGCGISPEHQERIFERFWRGDRTGAGSGLGLPIVRQIAAAHGGDLTVRSPGPSGDGSVFSLTLPR